MNRSRLLLFATPVLAGALLLSACGRNDPAPAPASGADPSTTRHEPTTIIGRAARQGIDKARKDVLAGNISLTNNFSLGINGSHVKFGDDNADPNRPEAELTPQGELLIAGKPVAADASQQALLKRYRGQIEQVALAGLEIGAQGADLAGKAMGEALAGLFGGDPDAVEKRIESEAAGIKVAATALCKQLPVMYETQQALAASMPEFKPYATLELKDIDDCMRDDPGDRDAVRAQVREDIRGGIRQGVRKAVRSAVDTADSVARGNNAAAEAEEASVEDPQTH